jgi:hypothetical protein
MSVVIDGTTGITTPAFTSDALTTTGNSVLGDSTTDTLNVGNGGLVKDASGNVGIGTASPAQKLHLASAGGTYMQVQNTTASISSYFGTTTTGGVAQVAGAYPFSIFTNGSERLTVDSSGNVGIGTASPAAKLHVVGDALANTFKLIANTTVSGSDATIFRPADNTLAFSTNGTERARINSSGYVTMPYQPMFSVTHSATETPAANGNFVQWTALSVASGSFSSGVYTAPVAGKYLITASLLKNTGSAAGGVHLAKNGANVYRIFYCDGGASGGYQMGSGQCILTLAANDTISLRQEIAGIGWYGDSPGLGAFSANLLG